MRISFCRRFLDPKKFFVFFYARISVCACFIYVYFFCTFFGRYCCCWLLPPSSFSVAPVGLAVKCKLCDCNNNGLIDAHDPQRESHRRIEIKYSIRTQTTTTTTTTIIFMLLSTYNIILSAYTYISRSLAVCVCSTCIFRMFEWHDP